MGRQLNRVRGTWRRLRRLRERIEQLKALAEKSTKQLSGMPRGTKEGAAEDVWAELADQQKAYEEQLSYYLHFSEELEFELSIIRDPTIRAAMECRYVDCKTVSEIADILRYDPRTIFRYLRDGKAIYEWEYDDYDEEDEK